MKKIFTFVSMALVAMSMNAQTETEKWDAFDEEGTLKADYVANEDPTAMSVVEFATANVTGTHTSGPIENYNQITTPVLDPKINNTWNNPAKHNHKELFNEDGTSFIFHFVQGWGNPVNIDKVTVEEVTKDGKPTGEYRAFWDDSYYSPDGANGLPTNGSYVTLKSKVAGTMKVAAWINSGNRDIYIVKESTKVALKFGEEVKASGYINGDNWEKYDETITDGHPLKGQPKYQETLPMKGTEGTDAYVIGAGNQPAWVYLTFDVVANETYYVFNKNAQIGFSGFEFTPSGETGISEIVTATSDNVPVYNLAGQRVSNDVKGLLIKNGKKFINK